MRLNLLLTIHRQPLDPMLAMAELSQMQVGRGPEETQPKVIITSFNPNLYTLFTHSSSLESYLPFLEILSFS